MRPIYISYRPKDAAIVERIAHRIMLSFGEYGLNMNPTKSCPGDLKLDYHIETMMHSSEKILIVIGQDWAGLDEYGRFRLSSADIPVYNELKAALRSQREVIVVLIDGAEMPSSKLLDEEFHGLYDLPVVRLRPSAFKADLADFIPVESIRDWFNYWRNGVWLKRCTLSKPHEEFFS